DAPAGLCGDLAVAGDDGRPDLLAALEDLRADAAAVVLPLMGSWPANHRTAAVRLLAFARGPDVAPTLIAWVRQWLQPERRARRTPRAVPPPRTSVPDAVPYVAILRTLRGHPSAETELFLRIAARDWDPTVRAAAAARLG